MKSSRIGLIGLGYWGAKYLRVLNEIPKVEIAFVVDTDHDRLNQLDSAKSPPIYEDLGQALSSGRTDAAIVVTPASTHRKVVQLCLESGAHVLVEKPLALSVKDALDLAQLSKESGRILYPGHIYAHHDSVRAWGKMIKLGAFGEIRYVTCMRTGLGPVRADVNVLWDLVPHDLTILSCLGFREPKLVRAVGSSYLQQGVEDVVFCTLHYPAGTIAHIQASWLDPYKIRRVTLVGSKRMALFDDVTTEERLKVYERGVDVLPTNEYGEFRTQIRSGDIHVPYISTREPLRNMVEDFLMMMSQSPKEASGELVRGLSIVSALEAMNQSMHSNGTPVEPTAEMTEQYVVGT